MLNFDLIISLVLPIILWLWHYHWLKGKVYDFDFGGNKASFPIVWQMLSRVSYTVLFLSLAGAGASIAWKFAGTWIVLMFAAVYALLFNAFTAIFYEKYLHQKYSFNPQQTGTSNYTAAKYATVITLGYSSLILFIFGLLLFCLGADGY